MVFAKSYLPFLPFTETLVTKFVKRYQLCILCNNRICCFTLHRDACNKICKNVIGVFGKNTSLETKFPSPKNTSRETKFSLKTGIFRKYPSQTWYICLITPNIIFISCAFYVTSFGRIKQIHHVSSWKRQTKGIIHLASVLNNIRCN
jgi:hypothetical protein